MAHFSEYVAIDPLALVLPMSVYVIIAEKLHPHEPKVAQVREALKSLSESEKAFVLSASRAEARQGQREALT